MNFNSPLLSAALICALFSLAGCAPFDVNISTNEPVEVNLNIDAHVYQHGSKDESAAEATANLKEVTERRRNRRSEIYPQATTAATSKQPSKMRMPTGVSSFITKPPRKA